MDEYVEREAVIERLEKLMQLQAATARAIVEAIPAADVRHVVTCGKCEFWTKQEASLQGRCALWGIYPTAAWFCANGCARAPLQEGGGGNGGA